jgi:hypothetical protein
MVSVVAKVTYRLSKVDWLTNCYMTVSMALNYNPASIGQTIEIGNRIWPIMRLENMSRGGNFGAALLLFCLSLPPTGSAELIPAIPQRIQHMTSGAIFEGLLYLNFSLFMEFAVLH